MSIASGGTLGLATATGHTLPAGNFSLNGNTLQLIPTATGTAGSSPPNTSRPTAPTPSPSSTTMPPPSTAAPPARAACPARPSPPAPLRRPRRPPALTSSAPTRAAQFLRRRPANNFALRVTAGLNITTGGNYTFNTNSDDGSKLYVDNRLVVNNDGPHGGQTVASPAVSLSAGLHEIRIDYEEGGGGYQLIANYNGPDTGNTAAVIGSVTPTGSTITGNIETLDPIANSNNVTVTNSGTINLSNAGTSSTTSTFTQVGLGTVTLGGTAPTFNVTGSAGQSLHLSGISLAAGVNNTIANTSVAGGSGNGPDVFLGPISGGGAGTTLTAGGTGQLFFDNTASANTGLTGATLVIPTGARVVAVGASAGTAGTNNPLGSAALSLSGGTLSLDTKDGGVTFANGVSLTGTGTTSTIESQPSGVVMTLGGAVSLGANNLNVNTYASDAQINGASLQISGAVTGTGNITKVASYQPGVGNSLGVLAFNGSNPAYSGTTTLAAGAGLTAPTANGGLGGGIQGNVATATDVPFGTGPLVSQGGTIYVRGSATANQTTYALGNNVTLTGDTTFDLAQSGGGINDNVTFGTLTLGGTGTRALNFTSANGYNLTFGAATSTVPANLNENNVSILTFASTFALGGATNVTLPDGGFVFFNGVVSGTGPFTVSSGGANGTGLVTLGAANTYAGNTNVTNGTLKLAGGTNTLPVTTTLNMTGGTLDLNTTTQTVAGLSSLGGAAGTITNTATGTATLNVNGTNTYNAALNDGGSGKVVALGVASGTTSLGGAANTYSGGSNVAAGATLSTAPNLAPASAPFGTGAITLNSGSTLKLTGVTTTAGGLTGTGLTATIYQNSTTPLASNYASLAALNTYFNTLTDRHRRPDHDRREDQPRFQQQRLRRRTPSSTSPPPPAATPPPSTASPARPTSTPASKATSTSPPPAPTPSRPPATTAASCTSATRSS